MQLTDAKIRGAKPKKASFRLNDGQGLFLIVNPSGSRQWQFRYRFVGRERTLSLGGYPQVSLREARSRHQSSLSSVEDGIDPSTEKKKKRLLATYRMRNTFECVTEEWLERNTEVWSEKHRLRVLNRLKNDILPFLGNRPIADIEPIELLEVIRKIERRGAHYLARRSLQVCSAIFTYAVVTARMSSNPAAGLVTALKPHVEAHLPMFELDEFPSFLGAFADLVSSEQNRIAFRLLLLTAVRTGELRHAKWSHLNLEKRVWRIPAILTKMRRDHLVPLSSQAVRLISDLKALTGESEFLFPSQQKRAKQVMSENTINSMIHRMGYKGRIVGHGFRSLFSTALNENGFNRDAIERQLAHVERNKVRAAYNRAEYLDERRRLMQWWADFVDENDPAWAGLATRKSHGEATVDSGAQVISINQFQIGFCNQ